MINIWFEVGLPQRITVATEEDALAIINNNIKYKNIYFTVYRYKKLHSDNKIDYSSCVLNKIFFDIDGKHSENDPYSANERSLIDARRMNEYCKEYDIKRQIFFSGRGFHFIIFIKDNVVNKRETLLNVQRYLAKKLDITLDNQIIGNIAALRRVPNTFNFRANRFCIPLLEDDLKLSFDDISKLALRQRPIENVIGNTLLDCSQFDAKTSTELNARNVEHCEVDLDSKNVKIINGITRNIPVPSFLYEIMKARKNTWDKTNGWRVGALIILWFRDNGISLTECKALLQNILTKEEYHHRVFVEKQVDYIYHRRGLNSDRPLVFPTIAWLNSMGYTLTKEDCYLIQKLYPREV